MTDYTDLTDVADAAEFDLPFHYDPDVQLPCFACFVETMLMALNNFDTTAEKQAAVNMAVTQIADCMGALFLHLAVDAEGTVAVFAERMHKLVAMNNADQPAMTPAPESDKHHH
jgi:hypothetical protein